MNIVKLAYFNEFQCIGPECPDSCCKGSWHIWLTKREYLNYKKMDMKPEFRRLADKCFKRTKGDDNFAYAEILHTNEGCSFLTEEGWCGLQRELGEKALGYVCRMFPRNYVYIENQALTMSCSATCCHVTELLIAHSEGLQITEEEYKGKEQRVFGSESIVMSWNGYPYYWNILNAEIDILQNRSFTVSERLLILGYFAQKTDEYLESGSGEKILPLAEMLLDNGLCKKIAASLKPVALNEDMAITNSLNLLLDMYVRIKNGNLHSYTALFDRVMKRLKIVMAQNNYEEMVADFGREHGSLRDNYRRIEEDRPYIAENILVNTVFSWNMTMGVWKSFLALAVFYNALRILTPAFLNEKYGDKELALALTYTVKLVLNTNIANEQADGLIKENKGTLPYAAFLVC